MEKEHLQEKFVIVVKRGNQEKFIAKNFYAKHHINCSIKPYYAKRFDTEEVAQKFWEDWQGFDKELQLIDIKKLFIHYQII